MIYKSNLSVLEIAGDSAVLTIENGKKNLLTNPEFIEKDVLEGALAENPQVTSLIITGAGRHFSHGADVSLFNLPADSPEYNAHSEKLRKSKELLLYIENLPIITVAAINGGCFGGGLEIALSCQFRFCSKTAFLGLPEINHGVIPGMNGIERLTKAIGKSKAISMILSGEIISASDAKKLKLVKSVSDKKNCMDDVVNFINVLKKDKTALQIQNIIRLANRASNGMPIDLDDVSFDEVLSQKRRKEEF
ncbi:MAG: enoyl-CoA hydratase/isomerase family protein [Oscillospiraceae bacterium]|nr:enoyl-CoA hydratase/isomerase family protein [Oscillospiraceae bacterium]